MTAHSSYPRTLFEPLLTEAGELRTRLLAASAALTNCIVNARTAKIEAKDAEDALTAAEQELLFEAMMLGAEGPFGKVSKTGKDFQIVYDGFLAEARKKKLFYLAERAREKQAAQAHAETALEAAQTQFSALRHACDLQAAVLHATHV